MKRIYSLVIIFILILNFCAAETIQFGSYWQAFAINGEKTSINWIILDETDTTYLLISEKSLDANIFGHNNTYTTWKTSLIRKFLNDYFYENAFSGNEKAFILLTEIQPDANPNFNSKQGSITKDYVFLLSAREAEFYFESAAARICYATDFAKLGHTRILGDKWGGVYTSKVTGATCWRLRTMGQNNCYVCYVRENGEISYMGDILYSPHYAVRPCIWVLKEGVQLNGN